MPSFWRSLGVRTPLICTSGGGLCRPHQQAGQAWEKAGCQDGRELLVAHPEGPGPEVAGRSPENLLGQTGGDCPEGREADSSPPTPFRSRCGCRLLGVDRPACEKQVEGRVERRQEGPWRPHYVPGVAFPTPSSAKEVWPPLPRLKTPQMVLLRDADPSPSSGGTETEQPKCRRAHDCVCGATLCRVFAGGFGWLSRDA